MSMFCYQCEQTFRGEGCTRQGVCGKDPETAALQDLTVHALKGLAWVAWRVRQLGRSDLETGRLIAAGLFHTVTNVNFDPERFRPLLLDIFRRREEVEGHYLEMTRAAGQEPEKSAPPATWRPAEDLAGLVAQGREHSVADRIDRLGPDAAGLEELLTYGLKGTAAYAHHAHVLGQEQEEIYAFFEECLAWLAEEPADAGELVTMNLRCGEVNLKVMELLDRANTGTYGDPEPTRVRVTPVKGKAILVSGHDLKDLHDLLVQTRGKGINVYTHGEMLPALAYPKLKAFPHLAGNYGGAWQDQQKEFEAFPGPVLMTTNCIQKPRESYRNRIFTTGLVGWPGVTHVRNGEFGPVIEAALAAEGFPADEEPKEITIGFGHQAVLGAADQVIAAVKQGAIRHFFLVGGCDGAKPGRNYYTDFARAVPEDCLILTLACGKYRFNKLDFGEIGGLPRLLDMGQCNDAYSAVKVAGALADAFGTDVNGLPLSLILSWYEQKAVCILLTLLHLGVRNIKLGPTLPAFVSPAVLQVLVDKFGIAPTTTVEKDMAQCLG